MSERVLCACSPQETPDGWKKDPLDVGIGTHAVRKFGPSVGSAFNPGDTSARLYMLRAMQLSFECEGK